MVKMSKEDFENGIGVLMKVCNQDLIDDIGKLAVAIRDDGPNSHNEENSNYLGLYTKSSIVQLVGQANQRVIITQGLQDMQSGFRSDFNE